MGENSVRGWSRSAAAAATVVALLVGAGAVAASEHDSTEPADGDTVFTFGYDADNHVLVVGLSSVDDPYDCTLDGVYTAGYGEVEDGTVPVDSLENADGPAVFHPRAADLLEDGEAPPAAPLVYGDPDNPCIVGGHLIAGPNGQVNHGQVVSTMAHAIDIAGKGCVMRWIAKSGFGKGADAVKTSDADPEFAPAETGEIDLTTVLASCAAAHGDDDDGDDGDGDDDEGGPPEDKKAKGRPESPGNSANAPGRNK